MNAPSQAWILAGATATGKTAAAQVLAEQLGCALLSADAMLVYRGMDIGTAKPTPAERRAVPYFGIDLVTPDEPFSTGRWLEDAARALRPPTEPDSEKRPTHNAQTAPPLPSSDPASLIVAGGTGLYIKALTEGLSGAAADPETRARWQALFDRGGVPALQHALAERAPTALASLADPTNPRRLIRALEHLDTTGELPSHWTRREETSPFVVLHLPREQLHARMARRVETMFQQGLVDEVQSLRQTYPVWSQTASQAIGYAECGDLLDGRLSRHAAIERIVIRTRQLAKRQETWFRHQAQAVWLEVNDNDPPENVAKRVLELWRQHGPTPVYPP